MEEVWARVERNERFFRASSWPLLAAYLHTLTACMSTQHNTSDGSQRKIVQIRENLSTCCNCVACVGHRPARKITGEGNPSSDLQL